MSSFLGAYPASGPYIGQQFRDNPERREGEYRCFPADSNRYYIQAFQVIDYLWPRSEFVGGAIASAIQGPWIGRWGFQFEFTVHWSGTRQAFSITGVTRDAQGTAVASATVKLFHTIDDLLLDSVVSDANGNFRVVTNYSDTHYLVAYLTGTPPIEGTTVNTIVGV